MKVRPILFSTPMVCALLEGRKTETRRIMKFPHPPEGWHINNCPYGQPGDLLWVRESFAIASDGSFHRRADIDYKNLIWKPSIHMPRKNSRLTLEIIEVKAQRLQEINEFDARAEGIRPMDITVFNSASILVAQTHSYPNHNGAGWCEDAVHSFETLWESINGKGSWDKNPWIWAISFKVHKLNVDQLLRDIRHDAA